MFFCENKVIEMKSMMFLFVEYENTQMMSYVDLNVGP